MAFSAGDKLGPYEILAKIGAGGMGEVYRAHDPRLRRDVAIKVSAERFSERFEREAHAVAALNHPNICAIYDVGPNYLVMEYVEGEAPKGPLPLEEALRIARQIGDALEEAHGKGIVHRDLKPANIKIKPDGTVKVLDFGLAKQTSPVREGGGENSPTISMAATQAGVILGTAGYMSPEQARGKVVDKRADIWAFGVVVHELLTGRKLFGGEDISDTLAAVIKDDPKWDGIPRQVQRLLKSCLEKDPKNRLRDVADAWKLLEDAPASAPSPSRLGTLAWTIAGVFAVALGIALWTPWRTEKPTDRPLVRLDVDLGPDVSLPGQADTSVIISPDGTRIVYVSGNPPRLFTRRLDQSKATELPGTEGAVGPFFSSDGQWVGFVTSLRGARLNKISVEGGAVVPIADLSSFAGGTWGEDGSVIVGVALTKGLVRFAPGGGEPTQITELAKGELLHGNPQMLPGGKAVLFGAAGANLAGGTIEVVTLADRKRKMLLRGTHGRYVPTANGSGHLIYTSASTLFAIPFDLERLETRGTALPILDDIRDNGTIGFSEFDVSPTASGTLVYRKASGARAAMSTVQWLDTSGKKEPLRKEPGLYNQIRFSGDGKLLAISVGQGPVQDLWVYDIQRDTPTRLASGPATGDPTWSPDGRYLIFTSVGKGIQAVRADGSSQPEPLVETKGISVAGSFTKDGKRFAFVDVQGLPQIFTVSIEEKDGHLRAGSPEQFLKSQSADVAPAFSLDGRWLAYASNESGTQEIYVRPFPPPASGQGGKWPISNGGGTNPVWSSNGRELLYQSQDKVMAVSYSVKGDTFVPDKPRVWIPKLGGTAWDLHPDGKRIAVTTPVQVQEAPQQDHQVVFLFNFFDELRRRVPLTK